MNIQTKIKAAETTDIRTRLAAAGFNGDTVLRAILAETSVAEFAECLETADLEILAGKYVALESLTRDNRWPDLACDALTAISDKLRDLICEAPCNTESDYRGKARLLAEWTAHEAAYGATPDCIIELAEQLATYRANA